MNFHYVAIAYDAQKILKSVTFTETQKSRYLENKTLFFLQTKKFINYTSRVTLFQKKNSFVAEVTLNTISDKANQKDLCAHIMTFKSVSLSLLVKNQILKHQEGSTNSYNNH